jgi:hypothetical protein
MRLNLTEDGRPIGHDGKALSQERWIGAHAVIARIEERKNARLAKEQKVG